MKKQLVTISEFARLTETTPQYISQLCKEPKIIPTIIGGVKFIDTAIYPVNNFKKQTKN